MVKILSRDSINRMVGRKSSVAGVGGGGGDVDLSGYATKIWTQETFVSIDFFRSLFRAYDSQNHEILPNDTTSTIDNIKAMFGFWTEQYLSALGQGSGGGGGIVLTEPLQSINSAGLGIPQSANVGLVWNGTAWTYGTIGTGSGTVTSVKVGTTSYSPVNGVVSLPAYPSVPTNTSQLTNDSGYITSSASITGNAGSATKLQTARTIWGQSFDGTANISGNMMGVLNMRASNTSQYVRCLENGLGISDANYTSTFIISNLNTYCSISHNGNAPICITGGSNVGIGTISPQQKLDIDVNSTNGGIGINSTTQSYLLMYLGGVLKGQFGCHSTNGIIIYNYNAATGIWVNNNGYVGIGTSTASYKLHVAGSIYATGGVTALSDARHKTIINPTDLQVEQIAKMPAVVYRWNDGREDNGLHVGSIAQDWQRVLPEVVIRANDKEGTLSMQYGVAALVSSIITARKVVDHEERLNRLERILSIKP
jgi:hypothetical protein